MYFSSDFEFTLIKAGIWFTAVDVMPVLDLRRQVVKNGSEFRQVLVPRHSPTASDGAQTQYKVARNVPMSGRRSASPPDSTRTTRGEAESPVLAQNGACKSNSAHPLISPTPSFSLILILWFIKHDYPHSCVVPVSQFKYVDVAGSFL